jgi:hypothetical protein
MALGTSFRAQGIEPRRQILDHELQLWRRIVTLHPMLPGTPRFGQNQQVFEDYHVSGCYRLAAYCLAGSWRNRNAAPAYDVVAHVG